MPTPDYLGEAHAASTSVSFVLPYGTDLLVIIGGRYNSSGNASPPTGATFNGTAATLAVDANSLNGSIETAIGMFYMPVASLPDAGSSYTAAFSGGSGSTVVAIQVIAFGGLNQGAPSGTDSNITAGAVSIAGLIDYLMIGAAMTDQTPISLTGGGTALTSPATRFIAAYHILTADETHNMTFSTNDDRDTSLGAMFPVWFGGSSIWM